MTCSVHWKSYDAHPVSGEPGAFSQLLENLPAGLSFFTFARGNHFVYQFNCVPQKALTGLTAEKDVEVYEADETNVSHKTLVF